MGSTQQLKGIGNDACNLDCYGRVLVKFHFTNPKWIPAGMPHQQVASIEARDQKHMDLAMERWENRAGVGRIREGRVDTGEQFIKNAQRVLPEYALQQLRGAGWLLLDNFHHFTQQPGQNRMKKHVVVLNFMRGDIFDPEDRPHGPSATTEDGIQQLAKFRWTLHAWANPNGLVTLNFVKLFPTEDALHTLVMDKQVLRLVDKEGLAKYL